MTLETESHVLFSIDPGDSGCTCAWVTQHGTWTLDACISHEGCNDPESSLFRYQEAIAQYWGGCTVVCEKVGPRRGNGASRDWSFANGLGRIYGVIETLFPWSEWAWVTPKTWMTDLDCLTGGDKNVTKDKATALFPEWKVTHRNADAMLIGYWWLSKEQWQ